MRRVKMMSVNRVVRRLAPIACAAALCLGAAACGATSKVVPNNAPAVTVQSGATTPGGATTTTKPAPTTTAPQTGGAGF